VHLIAHSLGAAYSVRLAAEQKELVGSLTLVAPTGMHSLNARPGMTGAAFYGLLQSPVLGISFYNVMTSERSIKDYARKELYFDKQRATPRMISNYYAMSHLPGAQHAIAAFLSGFLNAEIGPAFARLDRPVTLVWGRQDPNNPLEHAAALDRCRMMPQEEHPEKFNALVRRSLAARSLAA
jgi:pimeloyl-ACP methyl ester carboxylesterase